MSYSFKASSISRTGMQTASRFWSSHSSVSIKDKNPEDSGIPLDFRDGKAVLSNAENHCMICAVSGKGKTRRELYPSVVMSARAGRSIVVADMKGEIFRNTSDEVRRCGHNVRVINLRKPESSDRFSPLSLVKEYWDNGDRSRATILLKDICTIITAKIHSDRDMFWEVAAQDAISGFALFLLEKNAPLTFENIHSLFNEYFRSKDDRSKINSAFDVNAESYKRLSTVINIESDTTLSCIVSEVNASLSPLVDQKSVRDLLSGSDFDLKSIGEKPTAIYIVCPDESTSLYGIASLFVEQCYSELVAYADSRDDNRLPVKIDFILDEFGSFVGSNWSGKLTAARSRGIRFILAIQAMSQIIERYGDSGARTIMSNCRTLVFMGGRDIRLLSEISMLSGERTDERTGLERPVLSINDLSTLSTGEIVVLDDSGLPYIGHLPDWKDWGISRGATNCSNAHIKGDDTHTVSLRALLEIPEDEYEKDLPDETLPSDEPVEECDHEEEDNRKDMTLQSLLLKLGRDLAFEEELEKQIIENRNFMERKQNNIDDDDSVPF